MMGHMLGPIYLRHTNQSRQPQTQLNTFRPRLFLRIKVQMKFPTLCYFLGFPGKPPPEFQAAEP